MSCDRPSSKSRAQCAGIASKPLRLWISRTLGDKEFILGTVIEVGVFYIQTGNEVLRAG